MTRKEVIRLYEQELIDLEKIQYPSYKPVMVMTQLALAALRDQEERENPQRLTIEQLKDLNCPVWVSYKPVMEGDRPGCWCLCEYGKILTPARNIFDVEDIPHWKFYLYERKEE